jgi:uncharacterized protein (UPF0548 family)
MFLVRRPSAADVERFIAESRDLPLSYGPTGLARSGRRGFQLDEQVSLIGRGEQALQRATAALSEWRHFDLGWLTLFPRTAPIVPRTVVAVLVRHLGFWSLNACRVLEQIGQPGDITFGFSYGTLINHAECGEEIFQVSLEPRTEAVSYSIRAVSRPRALLARLGYPVTRSFQARFRRDSAAAMKRATSSQ